MPRLIALPKLFELSANDPGAQRASDARRMRAGIARRASETICYLYWGAAFDRNDSRELSQVWSGIRDTSCCPLVCAPYPYLLSPCPLCSAALSVTTSISVPSALYLSAAATC